VDLYQEWGMWLALNISLAVLVVLHQTSRRINQRAMKNFTGRFLVFTSGPSCVDVPAVPGCPYPTCCFVASFSFPAPSAHIGF